MKIAMINGQNHKGSTYHVGRMLAEKLAKAEDIHEIFLPKDLPEFCLGCATCILKDEKNCPHYKFTQPITELLDTSDLLIFTTPVYVMHATGSMKALLDHYAYRFMIHRPDARMFKKQAVCISTAAGAGMRSANKDIKDSLFYWGVAKIHTCGFAVAANAWDKVKPAKKSEIARSTDKLAKKVASRVGTEHPSLKTKIMFAVMRSMVKKIANNADYTYWKEKGWLDGKTPW